MYQALVTGGSSFIGMCLISKLLKENFDISVIVRDQNKIPDEWRRCMKIYEGDITDKKSISAISGVFEVVFHLAAYVHKIPRSESEKRRVFEVNVEGTKNLLNSVGLLARHIVFFSSVSVFGVNVGKGLKEKPTDLYGSSKLVAENILEEWGKERQTKITILRLPLVYGPGNKGNIYKMIKAIDNGRFVLLGKGLNKRSMVYVGNVVDAALAVVHNEKGNGKIYIVTDGVDYTVKELYKIIAKTLGKRTFPFYVPMRIAKGFALLGDIGGKIMRNPLPFNSDVLGKLTDSLTFSSGRIQEGIGFKPKYNLYNTIDETIKRYKSVSHIGRR